MQSITPLAIVLLLTVSGCAQEPSPHISYAPAPEPPHNVYPPVARHAPNNVESPESTVVFTGPEINDIVQAAGYQTKPAQSLTEGNEKLTAYICLENGKESFLITVITGMAPGKKQQFATDYLAKQDSVYVTPKGLVACSVETPEEVKLAILDHINPDWESQF